MSYQSAVKAVKSVIDGKSGKAEPVVQSIVPKSFHWNKRTEASLLFNMIGLKPCGMNKHLNVLLIRERMVEELNCYVSTLYIWQYLNIKWDIEVADKFEDICSAATRIVNFNLPAAYGPLILNEIHEMNRKRLYKDRFDEINRGKELVSIKRRKSNSMSSVEISEVGSDEPPARTRRSLRAYDKLYDKDLEDDSSNKKKMLRVNNKSCELNKTKDYKLCNKKSSNRSKELEKNDKVSNISIRKRKSRNVSESSISSDNSKPHTSYKNNLMDLTISDSSSRSITPELLRGKTSNRSITPESISRKSNLRSGDKDLKSKLALEKACIKFDHHVEIILPEIKIERLKSEKQIAAFMESKSKQPVQNKSEANNKVKGKTRGRVTSDFLVVQQSPDVPLGRRSCSNKSS